jgi:glycosyltransferase involved in cell wall biosynthesis
MFCTADHGGLADYAHAQAEALAARGHAVLLLVPQAFPHQSSLYARATLPVWQVRFHRLRWMQRLVTAVNILVQQNTLSRFIAKSGCRSVLFTTYSEYLAPLWAWRLRRWQRSGVCFAAVVHDPVRNYVVGPRWWHRLSIAQGYSFLNVALVHAPTQLDTGFSQSQLRTVVIPHGPYRHPQAQMSAAELRTRLGVPPDARLFLSFGHIRDNKNLQLVLQAMTQLPQIWLLVAGPEATAGQQPSQYYRQLANQFGVSDRCCWEVGYQSAEQLANHFTAADAILLTYSATFRSASGVMHVAGHYRKRVLASAGPSSLLEVVQTYGLGVVVPPDDSVALANGMAELLTNEHPPDWLGYEQANSWDRNAQLVADIFRLDPGS